MADFNIVNKVWNVADVLRDEGVSYSDYLEQITFLLFLKMVDENHKTEAEWRSFDDIPLPEGHSWDKLKNEKGADLKAYYEKILADFKKENGMIGEIYRDAQNKIQSPVNLARVISMIDSVEWNTMSEDVKGDIYEGLLEKNAQDTKSGAGQYFTPRALIKAIIRCVDPKLGKKITDPCCGSGGFLLLSKNYLINKYKDLDYEQQRCLKYNTFFGNELVPATFRLCLMNLLLHGIGEFGSNSPIACKDSLANMPGDSDLTDYVLTNPPFGTKSSTTIETEVENKKTGEKVSKIVKERAVYSRTDFIAKTTNKQLNFLQHIKSLLKLGGTAAVVLPDNVLFDGGQGETIRKDLLKTCDLHTILRLPSGIFYAQGVKANVLFFEKKYPSEYVQTKEVWFYDYRTNVKHTLKQRPLNESDLDDFICCYHPEDRTLRQETFNIETNPNGRWRKFTYDEIVSRKDTSLDITWLNQQDESKDISLNEMVSSIEESSNNIAKIVKELKTLLSEIDN